jgi:hypothetical protein
MSEFAYKQDEWAEIVTALCAFKLAPRVLEGLRLEFERNINLKMLGDEDILGGFRDNANEAEKLISDIRRLVARVGYRRKQPGDEIGRSAGRAIPHLLAMYRSAQREVKQWQRLGGRKRAPNKRPYIRRLQASVADAWIEFGGTVDQGTAYARFFEACVRPPLRDRDRAREWGDWSAGMCKTHVEEFMKSRGTTGKRGRKRRIPQAPSIVGPQN